MKYIIICLSLIFHCTILHTGDVKNTGLIKYIPNDVSFILYLNSLDKSFKEFKKSYFWNKYKLTDKGKGLEKTFNSIDASFLILGLTLDDLLQVFSQQAFVGIWLENNTYIKEYIYLIEKKKNKSKISTILDRLKFFAVANKINIKEYKQNTFKIISFTNRIFLAENKKFVLISPSHTVLSNICDRIQNNTGDGHNLVDYKKYFQNDNLIFYFNASETGTSRRELYYSFRFKDKPQLEVLYKNEPGPPAADQLKFNSDYFKILPPKINFLYFGKEDIGDSIYPFFFLIGTNYYKLDKEYFDTCLSEFDSEMKNPQLIAGNFSSKATNFLTLIDLDLQPGYTANYPDDSPESTYLNYKIFKKDEKYYVFIKKILVISGQIKYLKEAISTYKKNRGFYFTGNYKKILGYKNKKTLIWMNLHKYLTDKALKYGKDKWAHYNAYIKTYNNMIIYSDNKNDFTYIKLFFY